MYNSVYTTELVIMIHIIIRTYFTLKKLYYHISYVMSDMIDIIKPFELIILKYIG